jgi:hypothetical protein
VSIGTTYKYSARQNKDGFYTVRLTKTSQGLFNRRWQTITYKVPSG